MGDLSVILAAEREFVYPSVITFDETLKGVTGDDKESYRKRHELWYWSIHVNTACFPGHRRNSRKSINPERFVSASRMI